LDLGCGEGRLLADPAWRGRPRLGIDPSPQASARARRRGLTVCRAVANRLPMRDASIGAVVCTYPGPWILDSRVWDELVRVTAPCASVAVLLGVTFARGRGAAARGLLQRLAYGNRADESEELPNSFGHALMPGSLERVGDAWGTAYVWRGTRSDAT
jgi:SAM-dependent methyltransferase